MIWAFGDHELDLALYQLRRRGRPVPIEPKVFDVLLHLMRHRDRVVSKHELLDALWPGEAVSDSVLPRCVAAARRALRDDRTRQRVIATVHGRGYRFVARAEEQDSDTTQAVVAAPPRQVQHDRRGFVGRKTTMGRLEAAVDEVAEGRGRVVLLVGEPGIGKTRTAEELGAVARRAGAGWLPGRCYEGEGAPAFWPWMQVLRALMSDDEIAKRVPELLDPTGAPEFAGLDGEQLRFRLFDGIGRLFAEAAREKPLVIALDDVHWADADSLRLLQFLAGELRDLPVLLLASYRDVEVRRDHALRGLLGALAREPHCERVGLRGLGRDEVATLIERLAGTAAKPALVDAVNAMTEGNPFFVREVVSLLIEEGRLEGEGVGSISLRLPQGVLDAVGRRLDSLSAECNAMLRVAAVIGRDFETRLLERVAESDSETLLELLAEADAAQIVAESEGPGRYAFTHALLRQALYEELRAPQRLALHRRVAQALEALYGQRPDAPAAELAHHFFEAAPSGTAPEAVAWSTRAAEHSHRRLAYEESARHYERAVEALEFSGTPDALRRCELLVAWGDELRTGGAREAGRQRLGEAADIARALGRSDLLAQAAIGYRGFGEMGVPPDEKTLSLLEEARDTLGDGHPALRSRILARLTGTPPYSLSMETRDRLSREAWELACEGDDPVVLFDALGARYWATLGPDRIDDRLELARAAMHLSERLGDVRIALLGHEIEIGVYLMLGDRVAGDRAISAYARLADELRQPFFRFMAAIMEASRAMNLGEFDEAEQRIRTALERGRGMIPFSELLFAGQVFWLLQQKGEIERVAQAMLDVGSRFRDRFGGVEGLFSILVAYVRGGVGDLDSTRRDFDALAAHEFRDLERDEHWLLSMSMLAVLASFLGDAPRAAQLYTLLVPYADRIVSHDLLRTVAGSVHAVLGELALVGAGSELAISHYEQALAREEALGARPAFHASQAGLARALLARGGPGDAARAAALRAAAESGMQALGGRLPNFLTGPGSASEAQ